jgi:putative endonuclease
MGTQPLRQDGRGHDAGAPSTKARGDAAEDQALRWLQARGLRLLQRNYRTPGRGGGEIDLIVQAADGTVVFVEVRQRSRSDFGGAAASISAAKRQRIIRAAHHFLLRWPHLPPARFDVVALDGEGLQWLQAAFTAD